MIRITTFMTDNLRLLCIRHVIKNGSKDFKRGSRLKIRILRLWNLILRILILKVLMLRLKTRLRLKNGIWILQRKVLIWGLSWRIWTSVLILPLSSLIIRSSSSESSTATSEAASKIFPVITSRKNWLLATVLRKGAPLGLLSMLFLEFVQPIR